MANIDSNSVHIKLSAFEAIDGKREILESELILLNLIQNFRQFNEYRKQETTEKAKAVRIMHEIAEDVDNLIELLPKKDEQNTGSVTKKETKEKHIIKKGKKKSPEIK